MVIFLLFIWEAERLVLRCRYRRVRIIFRRRTQGRVRIRGIRISRDGDNRVVVIAVDVDGGDAYLHILTARLRYNANRKIYLQNP